MGSSVGRSCPLPFKLIIISDDGLSMGSSNCYITQWAAQTLALRKKWAAPTQVFFMPVNIYYTVVNNE